MAEFVIWTNTFCNLDKYIQQSGQINLAIWTNTFNNLDKYILQENDGTMHQGRGAFQICGEYTLDKYI